MEVWLQDLSSSNQIMGVRKTTDFLEKATWSLAGTVIVLSILITAFIPRAEHAAQSEIKQQVNDAISIDPNTIAPDFGTAQQPAVPAEETPLLLHLRRKATDKNLI